MEYIDNPFGLAAVLDAPAAAVLLIRKPASDHNPLGQPHLLGQTWERRQVTRHPRASGVSAAGLEAKRTRPSSVTLPNGTVVHDSCTIERHRSFVVRRSGGVRGAPR